MNVWQLANAASDQLIGTADKNGDIWLSSGEVVMTVITGVVIVFSMLVLLCLIILVFGKIMDSAANRKNGGEGKKDKPVRKAEAKAAPKADGPVLEKGVSPSVVAAIAAAIACVLGKGKFTIRKITRVSSRKTWGSAGAAENVRPF